MYVITANNIRDALPQAFKYVTHFGNFESTRVGEAIVALNPVTIHYSNPKQHVLVNPLRDANPFFHLMEAMWMLAGRDDAAYLDNYIKSFSSLYAKDGVVMDAYGHRWRYGYRYDQLTEITNQLSKDPGTRQAVLQMWGAGRDDLRAYSQKPCNLVVTFRIVGDQLDMTVFNRSNDLIWGCCGANAVHFPILQEYLADKLDVNLGSYWQVSTNLHLYCDHYRMLHDRLANPELVVHQELVSDGDYEPTMPLMKEPRHFDEELKETMAMLDDIHKGELDVYTGNLSNPFLRDVVIPMATAHKLYRNKNVPEAIQFLSETCKAEDWKRAGKEWLERRNGNR